MKRGLAFALAALALVAGNVAVNAADIDLSLNLRYTNPNVPAQGGRWFLMAKTNVAGANTGLAGLNVYLSNINTNDIVWGNATAVGAGNQAYSVVTGATLGANVQTVGNTPFNSTTAGITNLVYGQDLVTKVATIGEGTGTPGNFTADPLRNAAWANATLLISGTFAANRPAFAPGADGTVYNGSGAIAAGTPSISTIVRGDSVSTLGLNTPATGGLHFGDLNRNGTVSFLADISPALSQIGQGAGKTWEVGDFSGNGTVSFLADISPALSKIGVAAPPAPISAVPEPATVGMMIVGLAGIAAARRRK